ncbi:MAG: enoyl-CoA hydratase/isomerase family protein [Saprospiraceae bacterium]|jgi:2-(1,2-epoxy-1,2-dihydrophenyl)acetyl-CoA isomerase|nr:enoyl-CoA hydratase/isomerase family protein [Saprospiraceae bacterium]
MTELNGIKYELKSNVCIIYLNRPEVYNSFNREMSISLQKALYYCQESIDVRAVMITGVGRGFSAGQDLKEAIAVDGPTMETILAEHYNPIIRRISSMSKPVVAAVNGVAAGAGANLALACDIVLVSDSASFIQAFSKIGLIPDCSGTFFLPRLIGLQRAKAYMMTGEKINSRDALNMGIAFKLYQDEEFFASAFKFTQKLAVMPTKALALTKKALLLSQDNNLEAQLNTELELQLQAGASSDFKEGVAAFLEKRAPVFTGN